jgi:alpha-glucosidase (family GH31 glycosyl hydrolase)
MNEVSNFCNVDGNDQICVMNASNPCDSTDCCLICSTIDPTNQYDFPPFVPHVSQGSLGGKTISMNAYHAGGVLEYNAHNLYGFMEAIATQTALQTARPGQRAFMVTRSTYPGSGVYAAHWTGDNNSTWANLRESIITMNNLALFGIPMVGADICGFLGNTNAELCTRWIEVGAFSPFSRDHNGLDQIPQELYRWESVATASRVVLGLRYQLLPYLYTLLHNAHTTGATVLNAMWMHFPADPKTLYKDGQYMWSNGILFTPVLTMGATSVNGYFPTGVWYSLLNSAFIDSSAGGQSVVLDTPLEETNVHVRGGTILPMQNQDNTAMTTAAARLTPFALLVALDGDGLAKGSLYLDDGEQISLDTFSSVTYTAIPVDYLDDDDKEEENHVAGGTIQSSVITRLYSSPQIINKIQIKGVSTIKGDFTATPDTCAATMTWSTTAAAAAAAAATNMVTLAPEIIQHNDYSELVVTFDDLNLNIVSDFYLSWKCASSDDSTKKSDDDDEGWDAIPTYGQALIICAALAVLVGVTFGGYKFYLLHGRGAKASNSVPLIPSDESPAERSAGSLSIA